MRKLVSVGVIFALGLGLLAGCSGARDDSAVEEGDQDIIKAYEKKLARLDEERKVKNSKRIELDPIEIPDPQSVGYRDFIIDGVQVRCIVSVYDDFTLECDWANAVTR